MQDPQWSSGGRAAATLIGAFALSACQAERAAERCEATLDDDVRTRVTVSWSTPDPGVSTVTYGDGLSTPAVETEAGSHDAVLLGLPTLTDVTYRAVTEGRRHTWVCEGQIRTGNAPSSLPDLTVTSHLEGVDGGLPYLLGATIGQEQGLFLIDRQGQFSWWQLVDPARMTVDAQLVPGTDQVVYNDFDGSIASTAGTIGRVSLSGETGPTLETDAAHHVFAQIPGGFAYLAVEIRDWTDPETGEVQQVVGDTIVEIDENGATQTIWSSFDDVPIEDPPPPGGLYGDHLVDWTHGNALDYHAPSDTYLYTAAHLTRFFEIDRGGNVLRTFGRGGTYQVDPPPDLVVLPHDAHWTAAGTLLMTGMDMHTGLGGAVEYRVEEQPRRLVKIWSYGFDDVGLEIHSLGQARRLPGGGTIVNFGSAGVVHTVGPDGALAWEVETGLGTSFAQVQMFDGLYAAEPAGF